MLRRMLRELSGYPEWFLWLLLVGLIALSSLVDTLT